MSVNLDRGWEVERSKSVLYSNQLVIFAEFGPVWRTVARRGTGKPKGRHNSSMSAIEILRQSRRVAAFSA
jgi:hypothetical protein